MQSSLMANGLRENRNKTPGYKSVKHNAFMTNLRTGTDESAEGSIESPSRESGLNLKEYFQSKGLGDLSRAEPAATTPSNQMRIENFEDA